MTRARLWAGVMAAVVAWLVMASVTDAQVAPATVTPVLTIDAIPPSVVGQRPVVIAHLMTPDDEPVVGATLLLSVDGVAESRGTTVENGSAVLLVRSDFAAGTHTIEVAYRGSRSLALGATTAPATFDLYPGTMTVQTVPVMAELKVRMTPIDDIGMVPNADAESVTLVTGEDGTVRFPVSETGAYRIELVLPWTSEDAGVKAEFSRWTDNVFTPYRDVDYRDGMVFQAGFELFYEIDYQFTNLQGDTVDPGEIESITFKNSMGERFVLEDHAPFWVKGGRVTRRAEGLEETQLLYSVEEVIVDGTNVVNRAQLSFIPAETRSWTVPLLYYSVSLSSRDALFSFPVGDSVELISPGGNMRVIPLGSDGTVHLPLLPRGEYSVRVLGGGYSPSLPVMLSRDQNVGLKVISVVDVAFVGGLGAIVSLGLLLIGRWQVPRRLKRWALHRRVISPSPGK